VISTDSQPEAEALSPAADPALGPVTAVMRSVLWCQRDTSVREAAVMMSDARQSAIVFETRSSSGPTYGIATDSDLRSRVATGAVPIDAPVRTIATIPARFVPDTATAADTLLEMVRAGVHHMLVVRPDGQPCGLARAIDMSSADVRHPLLIRAAIEQAGDLDQLKRASALLRPTAVQLYDAGVPAARASALIGAMVEAIVARCISFDDDFRAESGGTITASWLVLGSLARNEPLPCSDVDTGLVLADSSGADRLLGAAERVIERFEACGLDRCQDGANATNPLFSRTRDDWLAAADRWLSQPDSPGALLLTAVVTDSRPISGLPLGQTMLADVEHLTAHRRFIRRLLEETLTRRPPTGFLKDFVVDASGEHRGELDLKGLGLWPVIAIGRWIAVSTRMSAAGTIDRLARGGATGLLSPDETLTLQGAYKVMFELLFTREIEAVRNGSVASTYVDPKELDSFTRRQLREAFRAITKVQGRLSAELV